MDPTDDDYDAPNPAMIPAAQIAWFKRTGHCGQCGQPGVFCLCTKARPCACVGLHVMGSGRGGGIGKFSDTANAEQAGLW